MLNATVNDATYMLSRVLHASGTQALFVVFRKTLLSYLHKPGPLFSDVQQCPAEVRLPV